MKIIKFFLFTLFLFSYLYFESCASNLTKPLRKNQKSAFPNTYESPIKSSLLKNANYEPPLFSRSLIELDPTQKIKKYQFLETIKYPLYKLTKGELELIFSFIDANRDDLIDNKEWENFSNLYILPFEACDSKGKMLLNENDFKSCFEADPKRGLINFREQYDNNQISKVIIDIISTRGASYMNLFDYVLFRRALYSWTRCQSSSKYIGKSHFKCAIGLFIPNKYMNKVNLSVIYKTGLKIAYDKNLIELDFIAYLRIVYFSFVYSVFNESNVHNLPFLEKTRFLKSIHEDRFPNNFDQDEINLIYGLTNNGKMMEFETFCFFFNLHRLFNKYSIKKPLNIHKSELLLLLNDTQIPQGTIQLIDESITNFSQSEYQEASLILGRRRMNEASFFNFKQDDSPENNATNANSNITNKKDSFSSKTNSTFFNSSIIEGNSTNLNSTIFSNNTISMNSTIFFGNNTDLNKTMINSNINKTDFNHTILPKVELSNLNNSILTDIEFFVPYVTTRDYFFNILCGLNKNFWGKNEFYKAFSLANLFEKVIGMESGEGSSLSPKSLLDLLPRAYDLASPSINAAYRKNLMFYKNIPNEIKIDLLAFLSIENFINKVNNHNSNIDSVIEESTLKVIMKDYGMLNLPDSVLDLTIKGYDSLRRRQFFGIDTFKNMIIVHASAGEIRRTEDKVQNHRLHKNDDISRKFPTAKRRFLSSPFI